MMGMGWASNLLMHDFRGDLGVQLEEPIPVLAGRVLILALIPAIRVVKAAHARVESHFNVLAP